MTFRVAVTAVMLAGICSATPQPKPNLSAEFSKSAIRALLAIRDGSEFIDQNLENAEAAEATHADGEAFTALKMYRIRCAVLSQAEAMAEAAAPGKCFTGIRSQLQSRTWKAMPAECKIKP